MPEAQADWNASCHGSGGFPAWRSANMPRHTLILIPVASLGYSIKRLLNSELGLRGSLYAFASVRKYFIKRLQVDTRTAFTAGLGTMQPKANNGWSSFDFGRAAFHQIPDRISRNGRACVKLLGALWVISSDLC